MTKRLTEDDLLHEGAIAITNYLLGAIEDAVTDIADDPSLTPSVVAEQLEGEASSAEQDEDAKRDAMAYELMQRIAVMMQARLNTARDWETMREIFPRERFLL